MLANSDSATPQERAVLGEVLRALRSLDHGYVQLIVQDRRAVQIDTMEKKRLERSP